MILTVSEMAKLLNVAPSTLRFYDREGLLPFVERSSGGTRVFTEKDYGWLKIISCLKSAGMPLKDIRSYIQMAMQGNETIKERLQMFYDRRDFIKAQMEELQQTLDVVEYKCWFYETAQAVGDEAAPEQIPDEELPEHLRAVRKKLRGDSVLCKP